LAEVAERDSRGRSRLRGDERLTFPRSNVFIGRNFLLMRR